MPEDLKSLIDHHKAQCNRYANGHCATVACLKRGGYKAGERPDYDKATCQHHEWVKLLEKSVDNT